MANILRRDRQLAVLHLLAEGASIRSTERLTHVHRDTICRLVVRFGDACRQFLDEHLTGLALNHLEIDEQWTYCLKKQARLTVTEREECWDKGDIYLWVAIDKTTKLIPTFALGKRTADNARRLMVDLAKRLVMPNPHAGDHHHYFDAPPIYITQISTDGFAGYPEAVDLAFGPYAKFGTIIKQYRNAGMQYDPSEMVGTERSGIRGINFHEERSICTSHVERFNGTTRLFMKRFNRLTYAFSKKLENLAAATAMYVANYDFCWRTRRPGKSGRRRPTAAMMAHVTDHLCTFQELFETVMG
jgi:IS1 family transposase